MRDCIENNGFFHKRLSLLTVQVWSSINCLGRTSRSTGAWSDANVLHYRSIMLSYVFDTRQNIHGTYKLFDRCFLVENARKLAVPLVQMNRQTNQNTCERYIVSLEWYVWYKKGSLLLRTGIWKVMAKTTYVLDFRYIKVQRHTLWY